MFNYVLICLLKCLNKSNGQKIAGVTSYTAWTVAYDYLPINPITGLAILWHYHGHKLVYLSNYPWHYDCLILAYYFEGVSEGIF